jgi:hypothetical protein
MSGLYDQVTLSLSEQNRILKGVGIHVRQNTRSLKLTRNRQETTRLFRSRQSSTLA